MSRDDLRRPLPLAYHPLYRFYEGGALTRQFRGLPQRPDDWWSEDWVGSCTCAGNPDPDGRVQGLSTVDLPSGQVTLKSLAEAWPAEMGDASVLVKLLSPAGPVPLHAHPARAWAQRHLGSPFGKTEAWILLDTPGDGTEPAYAGIGFQPGVTREWFAGAVRRHDNAALRASLHRTEVHPGEVYVAHAGVPHYLGPRLSFIEVQEPSDHIVIPETSGQDDPGATMGLGWGPGPGHDRLRHGRRREHARPRPPAAAGAADQPRLARGAAVRRRRHGVLRRHRARGGGRDRGRRRPLLDRDRHRGRRVGRG
jgi:mannose-6-phosphate isomerase